MQYLVVMQLCPWCNIIPYRSPWIVRSDVVTREMNIGEGRMEGELDE